MFYCKSFDLFIFISLNLLWLIKLRDCLLAKLLIAFYKLKKFIL